MIDKYFLKGEYMKNLKLTILFGFACSLLFLPFSAIAQDDVEEVVVTGTRIVDPNVTSSSQITSIEGEELLVRGITRVEEYLNAVSYTHLTLPTIYSV